MSFETVDHTADLAVRIRGADLAALIEAGVHALRSLLFQGQPAAGATRESRELRAEGIDREDLLVRSLSEALHLMQDEGLYPERVTVQVATDDQARLMITVVPVDGQHVRLVEEIKAVTYHGLEIRRRDEGLETLVVFDV